MTEIDTQTFLQDVALIVGGGPGISSSCARLFAKEGMRVAIAARNPGTCHLAPGSFRRLSGIPLPYARH